VSTPYRAQCGERNCNDGPSMTLPEGTTVAEKIEKTGSTTAEEAASTFGTILIPGPAPSNSAENPICEASRADYCGAL
jgi:hypothetical protein